MKFKEIAAKIFAEPWKKGAIFGFIFAAFVAILSAAEIFSGTFLEPLPQLLTSLPIYIAMKCPFDLPGFFPVIFFFIYWIALGASIGWAITRSKTIKITAACLLLILLLLHIKADQAIQHQIEGAIDAFIELIRVFPRN